MSSSVQREDSSVSISALQRVHSDRRGYLKRPKLARVTNDLVELNGDQREVGRRFRAGLIRLNKILFSWQSNRRARRVA